MSSERVFGKPKAQPVLRSPAGKQAQSRLTAEDEIARLPSGSHVRTSRLHSFKKPINSESSHGTPYGSLTSAGTLDRTPQKSSVTDADLSPTMQPTSAEAINVNSGASASKDTDHEADKAVSQMDLGSSVSDPRAEQNSIDDETRPLMPLSRRRSFDSNSTATHGGGGTFLGLAGEPRIRLEVLGQASLSVILGLTYLSLIMAIVSTVFVKPFYRFETDILWTSECIDGNPPAPRSNQDVTSCLETNGTVWKVQAVEWSSLRGPPQLNVDLSMIISENDEELRECGELDFIMPEAPFNQPQGHRHMTARKQEVDHDWGVMNSDHRDIIAGSEDGKIVRLHYNMTLYQLNWKNGHAAKYPFRRVEGLYMDVMLRNNTSTTARVASTATLVRRVDFLSPDLTVSPDIFHGWAVAIEFNMKISHHSHAAFSISHRNGRYELADLIIRGVLLCISIGFVAYYMHRLFRYEGSVALWMSEQKYILVALLGLVSFQDPLFAWSKLTLSMTADVLSMICISAGVSTIGTSWLLFANLMRYELDEPLPENFSRGKVLWGFGCFTMLVGFHLTAWILFASDPDALGYEKVLRPLSQLVIYPVLVASLIWLCVSIYQTRKTLRSQPYLRNRFRHLAFNFYLMQNGLVVMYWIIQSAAYLLASSQMEDFVASDEFGMSDTGTVIMISVYLYMLAYVYLPVDNRTMIYNKINNVISHHFGVDYGSTSGSHSSLSAAPIDGRLTPRHAASRSVSGSPSPLARRQLNHRNPRTAFSLWIARWLLDYAEQAFYDPEGVTTVSGWGKMDPERYRFEIANFIVHEETDCNCLVAKCGSNIVVAFRGTSSTTNWMSNARMHRKPIPRAEVPNQRAHDLMRHAFQSTFQRATVHSGFWNMFKSIETTLKDTLLELTSAGGIRHVYFTGHSLGGALAVLAGSHLYRFLSAPIAIYSFGAPRVGNAGFANMADMAVPCTYRIVMDGDLVTNLPKHWHFGNPYKHSGYEIIVDELGNVLFSATFVEKAFRLRGRTYLSSHLVSAYRAALNEALMEQGLDHINPQLKRIYPIPFDEIEMPSRIGPGPEYDRISASLSWLQDINAESLA
eukprot:Clim_evm23s22 gene=Clim_evmTU23s22